MLYCQHIVSAKKLELGRVKVGKAKTLKTSSDVKKQPPKRHPARWAFGISLLICLVAAGALFAAYWLYLRTSDDPFTIPFIGGLAGGDKSSSSAKPHPDQTFDEYVADTIFIGDSRTNGLTKYGYIPQSNVYAVDGFNHKSARTDKFLTLSGTSKKLTIAQAIALVKPVRMVVSFGINGVGFMDTDTFMSEYDAFLDELKAASPDTLLVVQSILPVSAEKTAANSNMSNRTIDSYNAKLKALVEEKGGVYLDSAPVLKNSKGALNAKFDAGDGLHFNRAAYQALLDFYDQNRLY